MPPLWYWCDIKQVSELHSRSEILVEKCKQLGMASCASRDRSGLEVLRRGDKYQGQDRDGRPAARQGRGGGGGGRAPVGRKYDDPEPDEELARDRSRGSGSRDSPREYHSQIWGLETRLKSVIQEEVSRQIAPVTAAALANSGTMALLQEMMKQQIAVVSSLSQSVTQAQSLHQLKGADTDPRS